MDICIDFDGTCVTHDYPKIGTEIGAVPVLAKLVSKGHRLILWTMRSGKEEDDARMWFEMHGIPLYSIGVNPEQKEWTTSNKAYAQIYIDDAALGAPLKTNKKISNRPFINWEKVTTMLHEKGIL